MLCGISKHCVFIILLILITTMNIVLLYYLVISFLVVSPPAAGSCGSVPIEHWGRSPSAVAQVLRMPVDIVVVTHTVTRGCDTDEECERICNAIRKNHRNQGRQDIGLSWLVGENGKIYEGAGWRVGNHTRGYDDKSITLSFIGTFTATVPSQTALKAAQDFLNCTVGWAVTREYSLVGHRQLISTASPGDALQGLIQTWPNWANISTRPH